MITQTYTQGKNIIKIESAESLEDAKANDFKQGEYSRYYINERPVDNFMTVTKFMVEEIKKNGSSFVPDEKQMKQNRDDLLNNQVTKMKEHLEALKKQYQAYNVPDQVMQNINSVLEKVNMIGLRTK